MKKLSNSSTKNSHTSTEFRKLKDQNEDLTLELLEVKKSLPSQTESFVSKKDYHALETQLLNARKDLEQKHSLEEKLIQANEDLER